MDKQIIIDGVDVSGCGYIDHDSCYCDLFITNCANETPNCYYKQLKRAEQTVEECHKYQAELEDKLEAKEQVCERLKETFDDLFKAQYKLADNNKKLRQCLTEIKEMCKEEKGWVNCSDMKLTETAQFAQQIFDKISEVIE